MQLMAIIALFLAVVSPTMSLECYTCTDQENNKDKCVKEVKQCRQGMSRCTATVHWSTPPYWTLYGGERVHYISKGCDTSAGCDDRAMQSRTTCKRDWYRDWTCMECCSGDLCNYYVTLGASASGPLPLLVIFSVTSTLLWHTFLS